MSIRIVLLPLLLLAACSEPRPADEAPPAPDVPVAVIDTGPRVREPEPDPYLPDFADPRLFLNLDSLRWTEWETPVTGDRVARLQALGITLIRSDSTGPREPVDTPEMGEYDPNGENARHFHLFDFTGDGVDDVVYSGPWYDRGPNGFGALEGTRFKLYQVMNGRAVLVLSYPGALQRIFRGGRGQPVRLRALIHGCCADPEWNVDYLAPRRAGDTVKYEPYLRLMGREGIVMPTQFMARPRPFTVNSDRYLLRASPVVDETGKTGEEWYNWEGHGNALAEYARGARGMALAERTDATGRVWWFVRMDGRTWPTRAQIGALHDDPMRMDRLGWMSSRFLAPGP